MISPGGGVVVDPFGVNASTVASVDLSTNPSSSDSGSADATTGVTAAFIVTNQEVPLPVTIVGDVFVQQLVDLTPAPPGASGAVDNSFTFTITDNTIGSPTLGQEIFSWSPDGILGPIVGGTENNDPFSMNGGLTGFPGGTAGPNTFLTSGFTALNGGTAAVGGEPAPFQASFTLPTGTFSLGIQHRSDARALTQSGLGSIHAYGYEDLDADGNLDPEDTAWQETLPGKKIDLFDENGVFITSQTTDANGQVHFLNLTPGVYMLQEDLSVFPGGGTGYIMASPDPDGPGGIPGGAEKRTVTVTSGKELVWQDDAADGTLQPGQEEELVDDGRLVFGNFIKGSIHAYGYEDLDADGNLDPEDTAWQETLPGKKIDLFDENGVFITSQTTDANGQVHFLNLTPGVYMLQEDLSVFPGGGTGYIMASPDPDGPGGIPGGAEKRTVTVTSGKELVWQDDAADGTLQPGQEEELVDDGRLVFGNFIKGSIHAYGYEDLDADGNLDPEDTAWQETLPGKKIDLFDENGVFITSQTTDANGQVHFLNLTPGVYMLQEDLSVFPGGGTGYIMASPDPDGPGGIPGGAEKRTVTVTSGKELVWQDDAADGTLQPGQEEELVDDGRLVFGNFIKGSIHAYGYEDLDADGNLDPEDTAWQETLPGKKIDLFDENGVFITSQTTDANGQVHFLNLTPGVYMLQEDLSVFPGGGTGYIMASPDPDGPGGIPGGAEKRTVTVTSGKELVWQDDAADGTLQPGQEEELVDDGRLVFGNFIKGSIHAYGYEDLDADGNLDPEDTAWQETLPGKKIDLFDENGVFITSQTTDANGQVHFLNLTPGVYMLQEDLSVFPGGGTGYIMASPDPDGPGGIPGGAEKRTVTVTSGKELVWQDDAADGTLQPGQEEELVDDGRLVFGNFIKGSIHAYGYEDLDADGNLDPEDTAWQETLPGKKIDLFDENGVFITSQTTDANGQVHFLNLTPGVYMLQEDLSVFPGGGTGYIMASPDPDGPGGIPGGAEKRTVTVTSGKELVWQDDAADGTLQPGQEEELVDDGRLVFGNFIKGSIHAYGYEDLDADGNLDPEDTAWQETLPGKKIDLFDENGVFITSQTTDANGQVHFLNLTPGVYMLQEDLSVFPGGGTGYIMASPDPDGPGGIPGGAEKRTVTVTSGKELVWQDDAADGTLQPGQEEELVDDGRLVFGNFIKGSIHAYGYEDLDADGNLDPRGHGLAGDAAG